MGFRVAGAKRVVLLSAAVLVVAYSLAVLVHVTLSWDIGFRCFFTTEIRQVIAPEPLEAAPDEGDVVLQIGPIPVRTYLDVQPAVELCKRREPVRLAPAPSVAAQLHEIEETYRRSGQPVPTDVQIGSNRYVRVLVQREGQPEPFRWVWASVGRVPWHDVAASVLWLLLNLSILAVGAIVLWKRPQDRSASLFFELCTMTVGSFMGGFHWWTLIGHPFLLFPFVAFAMMLPATSLHFYLAFPRPKEFFDRYPRTVLGLVRGVPWVCTLGMVALMARVSWLYRVRPPEPDVVQEISSLLETIKAFAAGYVAFAAVLFAGCLVALAHSFWSSRNQVERNQVKWILFGAALATLPVSYTLYLAVSDPVAFALGGATPPMFLASLCFTLAFAVAITRYRLMQVGEIINRSVVYFGISTAVAILYYVFLVVGSLWWGSQLTRYQLTFQSIAVSLAVVFILAALGWGLDRLRAALEQRFWLAKGQLDRAVRKMGEAIRSITDETQVAQRMLEATADLLNVRRGAVYVPDDEERASQFGLAASLGIPPRVHRIPMDHPLVRAALDRPILMAWDPDIPAPLRSELLALGAHLVQVIQVEGRPLAVLMLGSKPLGAPFTAEETGFLTALGQVTALALDSAKRRRQIDRLSQELREKVEQIAEQQRRILVLQSQLTTRQGTAKRAQSCEAILDQIRGSSRAVQQMLEMARKVAAVDAAVLIQGESGTGKELLARAIHALSPRADGPFVPVHCAALSPSLLESELFGHVKGAFTGAYRDKPGRFELADGGTLFLDEIGDISLDVQTKLLRVLQEMAFEPVGSTRTIHVDVRLVAATHQDLQKLIRAGKFREDLYYRLNVITIYTPSLRERMEDIPELVEYFIHKYARECGKDVRGIDDDALSALKAYPWPGNVRELENVIERAVVLCEGSVITRQDLPREVIHWPGAGLPDLPPYPADRLARREPTVRLFPQERRDSLHPHRSFLADIERERILAALREAKGNKSEAARLLGLPRSTLISKLRKYRLA
jgi:transcriptional regulator with GAF, ATPase, and Fis domain